MKTAKFLSVIGVVLLVAVFALSGAAYAKAGQPGSQTDEGKKEIEDSFPEKKGPLASGATITLKMLENVKAVLAADNAKTEKAAFVLGDARLTNVNPKGLLRNLIELGVVVPMLAQSGDTYSFQVASPSERSINSVLYTENYATKQTDKFLTEVDNLKPDQIAVIIATDETWETVANMDGIKDRIASQRIKILSVPANSAAFLAFERLFAGQDRIDLGAMIKTTNDILSDKNLTQALESAK